MMMSFFSGPRISPQWLTEYDSSSSFGEFGEQSSQFRTLLHSLMEENNHTALLVTRLCQSSLAEI